MLYIYYELLLSTRYYFIHTKVTPFLLQTVRALGKMRFNKTEVAALALGQPSHKFEKEGVLFVKEKQEGFFRRSESKYKYLRF